MSMARLFLREAFLTVGTKQFSTRIAFEIKQNDESDPNKAKISLYNLSADSRAYLEKTEDMMRLEAGYKGDVGIIFWGDISDKGVKHERKGGDIITTMQCGDGLVELQSAHLEFSWEAGVTCQQIVDKALSTIGLHLAVKSGDLSKQYLNGKAYSGTVKKLLDQITKYCGLIWNTQNNSIQIYPANSTANQNAVLLNSTTGLIGIPSKTEKGIMVRSLLNHRLTPGGLFQLETKDGSKTGSGLYAITAVKHVGDTFEGEFYTEVEGEIRG
jgi:hypothetical protein